MEGRLTYISNCSSRTTQALYTTQAVSSFKTLRALWTLIRKERVRVDQLQAIGCC